MSCKMKNISDRDLLKNVVELLGDIVLGLDGFPEDAYTTVWLDRKAEDDNDIWVTPNFSHFEYQPCSGYHDLFTQEPYGGVDVGAELVPPAEWEGDTDDWYLSQEYKDILFELGEEYLASDIFHDYYVSEVSSQIEAIFEK